MLNDIEKLRFYAHKVLPLVYDDSLSYYEVLCKVVAKLNEVIALADSQNSAIEDIIQDVEDFEAETNRKYGEFTQHIDDTIDGFMQDEMTQREKFEDNMIERADNFEDSITDQQDNFETDMLARFTAFLNTYQRTFGIVDAFGQSRTEAISQRAVSQLVDYTNGTNLLNMENIASAKILNQNGELADGTSAVFTTDYVEASANDVFTIQVDISGTRSDSHDWDTSVRTAFGFACAYSAIGEFISGSYGNTLSYYTCPSGTAYVRFSIGTYLTTGDYSNLALVKNAGSTIYPYEQYGEQNVAIKESVMPQEYFDIARKFDNKKSISRFLYKKNTYINASGQETAINGYDVYKIPCEANQIIHLMWFDLVGNPWNALNLTYFCKIFKTDESFISIYNETQFGWIKTSPKEAIILTPENAEYITLSLYGAYADYIQIEIDVPYETVKAENKVDKNNTAYVINDENTIKAQFYVKDNGNVTALNATAKSNIIKVKQGDKVYLQPIGSSFSTSGNFKITDGTGTPIGTVGSESIFTAPTDGIIFIYSLLTDIDKTIYNPNSQIKIDAKNIIGLTDSNNYAGLNGVAFGTSLTYRSIASNGYLTRLSTLSGITFDNQGIGSGTILGNGGSLDILARIKSYASYSGKKVCILEGFVNDWFESNTLGTWNDNTETTVCGCVRSALNYMLTQNPNMTVFLILDHYGRNYSSLDCSSTVVKGGKTQYEYYEEIAKVAESLGVPVIKEYALSGISELMPQYLADNIHLNALGATQSGNTIWSEIKNIYPNAE